ncbi:MAG: radical SAM protein [Candidatus Nanoarchaeia archaeon]|nr:radical SAM protein [Candidatus Nanoarchaeia archaeon]MDD5587599.1 radical SAM protein [Candidatus Nanoarchaeia archaeon]
MKVMLVYPNDRMDGLVGIGIPLLSAHLKKAGHQVKLYDTTFFDTGKAVGDSFRESLGQVTPVDLEKYGVKRKTVTMDELKSDFRKAVLDYHPDLVGFSSLEMSYDQGLELVKGIQDIPVPKIFGGVYPTFAPRVVFKEPSIDMIGEGECEEMLPELATALEKGYDITKILNLIVKKDGKIYRSGEVINLEDLPTGNTIYGENTGLRRPPTNLETLLAPDYSIFDDRRFWKRMGGKAVRTVAFELSRGCPFSCTFCCIPVFQYQHKESIKKYSEHTGISEEQLKKEYPYRRYKPIPSFISEVEDLIKNHGLDYVYFTDESFLSMTPDRFKEFIDQYKKRIYLPFFIEARVETVKPGYAEALESAGCEGVAMGVESGSIELRKNLLKRFMSDEQIINAFKEFEKTKIRVSANNIIGFPGETREDIMKTIELNRKIHPNNTIVNAFRPYSGTELRRVCIEKNLIPAGERAEDNRIYGAFNNGALTAEELEGIRRVFNLYVKLPKERWDDIKKAERDDKMLQSLREEFFK